MNRLRNLGAALWLALALVVGQQAALLHELTHATEQLTQKQVPTGQHGEQCFHAATLANAIGSHVADVPAIAVSECRSDSFVAHAASLAPRLAFHSRAPPVLL